MSAKRLCNNYYQDPLNDQGLLNMAERSPDRKQKAHTFPLSWLRMSSSSVHSKLQKTSSGPYSSSGSDSAGESPAFQRKMRGRGAYQPANTGTTLEVS